MKHKKVGKKLTPEEKREYHNALSRDYAARCREQKICVTCGIQDDRTLSGRWMCEKCAKVHRAKARQKYYDRKKLHICAYCGRRDERTLAGFTRCEECTAKINEYVTKRRHGEHE